VEPRIGLVTLGVAGVRSNGEFAGVTVAHDVGSREAVD
jgi:hypothetical protein